MPSEWVVVGVAFAWLGALFAIAWWGDRRAEAGRSVIANPWVYSLSLAVYATAWTFYGSVGRAASAGVGFLPIYIGPTLVALLGWTVLRKMIRVCKVHRITSLADLVAARYGKSALLAAVVTVIALVGILPYVALQLKAIATGLLAVRGEPATAAPAPLFTDSAFSIAMLLAAFTVIFGTRHLDASERHEGMVAAVAVESVVKLAAFLAVGAWVTWGLFDGPGDLFGRARALPGAERLFVIGEGGAAGIGPTWSSLVAASLVSMLAVLLLPRQFQVAVVEAVDERHVRTATWLFPLYLLAINLFVPAIAFGGLVRFAGAGVDPDTFVLSLPLAEGRPALAVLAFVGGLSAATGMVIVETIALSTMVCNDLVMPLLLRWRALRLGERTDLTGLLLGIRRAAIVATLLLGYLFFRLTGEAYPLVSIGLFSFAAVAQFAPALLGGLYWKEGTRAGALAGLLVGFGTWGYTLVVPAVLRAGGGASPLLEEGPLGAAWLRPTALLGVGGMDELTHAILWSLLLNAAAYVAVSLASTQRAVERSQAHLVVDVFRHSGGPAGALYWRGGVTVQELRGLLSRFLGREKAGDVLESYARQRHLKTAFEVEADASLVQFAETQLAGAIGGASAHAMVASVVKEAPLTMDEVMGILEEASQIMKYSRELERKSAELEAAYAELRTANAQLKELDRMKDEFVSHVSHELRTPLTSIRAFSEILRDHPDLDPARRAKYLEVVIAETERLTRLINDVLDLAKIEAGGLAWALRDLDPREVVEHAVGSTRALFEERGVSLDVDVPEGLPRVVADRDRLVQVLLNLLSNAAKYGADRGGRVRLRARALPHAVQVEVRDEGPGIPPQDRERIFQRFRQSGDTAPDRPRGTGLGLAISREIVERFGGRLWLEEGPGPGATFSFTVPAYRPPAERGERSP